MKFKTLVLILSTGKIKKFKNMLVVGIGNGGIISVYNGELPDSKSYFCQCFDNVQKMIAEF